MNYTQQLSVHIHGVYLKVINSICFVIWTILCNIYTLNITYLRKKLNENISEILLVYYTDVNALYFLSKMCFNKNDVVSNVLAA